MTSNSLPLVSTVHALRQLVDLWDRGLVVAQDRSDKDVVREAYTQAKAVLAEIGRTAENSPPAAH